jgi:FAD binding domain/D-arabinono-1,4-lactone oxidase
MLVLILFFTGLIGVLFISRSYTTRPFWVSVFSGWLLFFVLLIFWNPQHVQAILEISSARVSYYANWGSTVVNHDFVTIVVPDVAYLQNFMRTTTEGVRPAGSMHSFSPLMSTLGSMYVVDIRQLHEVVFLNSSHIRVGAGSTIQNVQKHLAAYNKTLRGIGSYTGQTLAGGFSTSLAGIEMVSFSSFVTWAKTVNGRGETVEWHDLYFLRDSMGMMGIIVELEFEVFDNYYLHPTVLEVSLDDLISTGFSENIDAFDSIMSFYSDHQRIKAVSYTRSSNESVVRDALIKADNNVLNLFDYFWSPISFIIPTHLFLSMIDSSIINKKEQLATIARDTHMFGLVFLDYRIPISNCTAFFKRMLENPQDGIVRIKLLESRDDTCLAYTGPSCKIELYVPAHTNIVTYEHLAWEYGGYTHWGKYFRGNIREQMERFSCFPEFEMLRKIQDPTDRFLNAFLKGDDYQYWHGGDRLWIFYILLVHLLVVSPIWFVCQCIQGMRHKSNKYVRLEPSSVNANANFFTNVRIYDGLYRDT